MTPSRPLPTTLLLCMTVALAVAAGCAARGTQGLPEGSISEGGMALSPYYCQSTFQKEGDKKPRIYLFGTVKAANLFADKREVGELNHKKVIGAGKNRETIVVETSKDLPGMEDRLIAEYKRRNGM